jgi:hypothetical protein
MRYNLIFTLLLFSVVGMISGCKNLPRDNPLDKAGIHIMLEEIEILGGANVTLKPGTSIGLNLKWKNTGRDTVGLIKIQYRSNSPYIILNEPANRSFVWIDGNYIDKNLSYQPVSKEYKLHNWQTYMNFDVQPFAPSNPDGTKVTFEVDMKMNKKYTDKNGFWRIGEEVTKSFSFDLFIY